MGGPEGQTPGPAGRSSSAPLRAVYPRYCPAARLAIEVDGWGHTLEAQVAHDLRRDAFLRANGIEVLRILAVDVMRDPDGAPDGVWQAILTRVER